MRIRQHSTSWRVCLALVLVGCSAPDLDLLGSARKPLVLVGGQTEQIPSADYISSIGGATFNGTAPTAAGDVEADTFNGVHLTGSGGTGAVSVVLQQSAASSPNIYTVNLTTEGTIDWIATGNNTSLNTCQHPDFNYRKVSGGGVLACPGNYPWIAQNPAGCGGGTFSGSCGGSCSIGATFTASDSTGTPVPTSFNYQSWNGYNCGAAQHADQGWVYVAPALTTQLVFRTYLSWTYTTGGYCVGTLSDGSGTATTVGTPINTGGTGTWVTRITWTYHAASADGALLIVVCHLGTPGTDGSGGASIAWLGETLGVI